ncbi:hypothetical protein GJAV_G00218370 [Gymnothorax javanicus]|nr:hypothetical protein GJAV_G00218370 [Gymnothorax javanicus]
MMENCHELYLLLATGILYLAPVIEGAPLSADTGLAAEGRLPLLGLSLAVSVGCLLALVLLLLNCASCCKEQDIDFQEFNDNFPDEADFTPPAEDTPSLQPSAEVYTLAVPPVPLPGPPHLDPPAQPGIREASTASQVTRQSLSYIQEIGAGWFGKVLLSEMFSEQELGASRVLVQELKASADPLEQRRFLQQAEPYRVLQHPNIVHCLGQCVDSIPFLLVFEHCDLGDLKGCLRQQDWMPQNIELLQLQKMACEIAAGITHLHKHNFLHSDLALRNCFLTSDLTVKVGDYGTGPSRYKDDYITGTEEPMVPLRWIAPELINELQGGIEGLVMEEQTKPGNVWALGVTLWELLESAAQPYSQLSDQEVLNHVIKAQQVKLPKPQVDIPYPDRWYETLQFCWLPEDKRATAEEVHRLLTYLRMQGQRHVEEDFQQRWDALRPRPTHSLTSFPILDRFSEPDELLTVTETSHGLSFEYVWGAARHDTPALNQHSVFFPDTHCKAASPSETTHGVPSIFDAQTVGFENECYMQLPEQELGKGAKETQGTLSGGITLQNVSLQDSGLNESGTDPDFFHHSLDSRDSNPASQPESPYRTHMFGDGVNSAPDQQWTSGLLELPEFSASRQQREAPSAEAGMSNSSSLGAIMDLRLSGEPVGQDAGGEHLLDLPNLSKDFLFPQAGNLVREGGNWVQRSDDPVTDSGSIRDPDLGVISIEYSEVATSDEVESGSDPALSRVGPPNSLMPLPLPLIKDGTLVPSEMPEAMEDDPNNSFCSRTSPDEQCCLKYASKPETDLVFDPASDPPEVTAKTENNHSASFHQGDLCNDLKNLTVPEILNEWPVHKERPAEPGNSFCPSAHTSEAASIFDHATIDETVSVLGLTDGIASDQIGIMSSCTTDDSPIDMDVTDRVGPMHETFEDYSLMKIIAPDKIALLDGTTSEHGRVDESVSDLMELMQDTISDCDVKAEAPSDLTCLRDGVISESDLKDEMLPGIVLTSESDVGLVETASNQRGLREEPDIDGSVMGSNLKDKTVSNHLCLRDNNSSDCGITEGLNDVDPHWYPVSDGELQESTNVKHLPGLPEDPSTLEGTPNSLIPNPLLEKISRDVIQDDCGLASVRTMEHLVQTSDPKESLNDLQLLSKTNDSTQDTKNLDSPEWSSQPVDQREVGPDGVGPCPFSPEVIVSVTKSSLDAVKSISNSNPAPLPAKEEILGFGNQSYRDSAYFSDNESESEKRLEENGSSGTTGTTLMQMDNMVASGEASNIMGLNKEEEFDTQLSVHHNEIPHEPQNPCSRNSMPEPVLSPPDNCTLREIGSVTSSEDTGEQLKPWSEEQPEQAECIGPPCPPLPEVHEGIFHAKLVRMHAGVGPGPKLKERDVEGRYLVAVGAGAGDWSYADEEDENSEDSDDEVIEAYHLHSSTSDSDDEPPQPAPIIIMDTSHAGSLKSLLKAGSESPATADAQSLPGRKAVSFFNDVTLYLFDQETPTKDLSEHLSRSCSQASDFCSRVPSSSPMNRVTNSDSSTDEEGGAFEWDDDFSPPKSSSSFISEATRDLNKPKTPLPVGLQYFSPSPPGHAPEQNWPRPSVFSRFSISPASVASLSLTHLTDSDVEQGSSEDGEKE